MRYIPAIEITERGLGSVRIKERPEGFRINLWQDESHVSNGIAVGVIIDILFN